ncbi:MAG TPA: hypothetical protein VGA60_04060 [Kiloniellales bacterium]
MGIDSPLSAAARIGNSGTPNGWFAATPAAVAGTIARLADEDAASLLLLDASARRRLTAATARLPFRPAIPVVGEGAKTVHQEFTLCMDFPRTSLFLAFAAAFEHLVDAALAYMAPAPVARPFHFNDLIVQRYERGDRGITAHRDHLRYKGLIAVIPLSGAARFFVCADRAGHAAREIPAPAGSLVLMRGPAYAGRHDRPFHFVRDVTRRRLSLGLRYDTGVA